MAQKQSSVTAKGRNSLEPARTPGLALAAEVSFKESGLVGQSVPLVERNRFVFVDMVVTDTSTHPERFEPR